MIELGGGKQTLNAPHLMAFQVQVEGAPGWTTRGEVGGAREPRQRQNYLSGFAKTTALRLMKASSTLEGQRT